MPAHRKPNALKLLHGNRRGSINQREPRFKGAPMLPSWLHPLAKTEWKRLMAELSHLDMLKATDQAALAAYCQSYARWITAESAVEAEGQLIREPVVTRSGNISGYRMKKNPAVTIAKDERACMLSAGRLFGLSPVSRAAIHTPSPEAAPSLDDDDIDDLLRDVDIN
jgi:P27 family predicted phage terminase small subunit